uniref:Uncharacterized protein n=1 Tax=Anopheles atroparvus TaxID=41427 RepID=A0A182IUR3_ANOAO
MTIGRFPTQQLFALYITLHHCFCLSVMIFTSTSSSPSLTTAAAEEVDCCALVSSPFSATAGGASPSFPSTSIGLPVAAAASSAAGPAAVVVVASAVTTFEASSSSTASERGVDGCSLTRDSRFLSIVTGLATMPSRPLKSSRARFGLSTGSDVDSGVMSLRLRVADPGVRRLSMYTSEPTVTFRLEMESFSSVDLRWCVNLISVIGRVVRRPEMDRSGRPIELDSGGVPGAASVAFGVDFSPAATVSTSCPSPPCLPVDLYGATRACAVGPGFGSFDFALACCDGIGESSYSHAHFGNDCANRYRNLRLLAGRSSALRRTTSRGVATTGSVRSGSTTATTSAGCSRRNIGTAE